MGEGTKVSSNLSKATAPLTPRQLVVELPQEPRPALEHAGRLERASGWSRGLEWPELGSVLPRESAMTGG